MGPRLLEGLSAHGRLAVTVRDAATGRVAGRRVADNLIVTSGVGFLASALNYALVLTQNASWGGVYAAPGAFYGAVGLGSSVPSSGQTALDAEVGRAVVSNAAVSGGLLSYDFFFPTSLGNGSLTEVGTFGGANLITPTLTAGRTAGSVYTSLAVGGVTGAIPSGASLVIGYGTGTTQKVTTTAQVGVGATTIPVSSFTASASFAAGSLVGYTPGTLIDRAVFASPITKSSAQTMTLNFSLTLTAS